MTSAANDVTRNELDLQQVVDEGPLTQGRVKILFIILLAMLADGFDLTIISVLSPAIVHNLHVTPAQLGLVFSAGLLGMMAGSGIMGVVGDVFGRRPAILLSMVLSAAAMLAAAGSPNLMWLAVWRFATGIGIGAIVPLGLVLASEYAPRRVRATVTACMFIGVGGGGTGLAAWLGTALLPSMGWRAIFVVSAAFNLLITLLLAAQLPESLKFLYTRSHHASVLLGAVRRLDPSVRRSPNVQFIWSGEYVSERVPYRALFAEGRGPITLLLWIAMFCAQMTTYALVLWLPIILGSAGVAPAAIGVAITLHASLATVGGIAIGWVIDRYGAKLLAILPLIGVPFLLLAGVVPLSSGALVLFASCVGIPGGGTLQGLPVVSGMFYPTAVRSNGVGIAMLISRFGSILGPVVLSVFIAQGASAGTTFAICALPLLVCGCATLALARLRATQSAGTKSDVTFVDHIAG